MKLTTLAGKQVKKEGIHQDSRKTFKKSTKNLLITSPLAKTIQKELEVHLEEEGSKIPVGSHLLGTSDVIESIFGKYKSFTNKSPVKELGKLLLTIPVFTTKITTDLVKKAMETIKKKNVDEYSQETLGTSISSKRRKSLNHKEEQKVYENNESIITMDPCKIGARNPIKEDIFSNHDPNNYHKIGDLKTEEQIKFAG